ncbi:hypothetical protein CF165_13375 [Amycolatopsis vastitatis]|uniref:SAM-dependent methyltransferase n=2 Tax=Amycolatopsis vastitatis TaxID=1905142 RepID=A0A229TBJ9_9PSEU|nr:hypothetical protein CF165_13375 [Amycolatopsis vastitatis]
MLPFEVQHHATMVGDRSRLEAYQAALRAVVRDGDRVVDAGTGTGVLISYAAALTRGAVYGIEYFPAAAALADRMVRAAGMSNALILNENVFHASVDAPDVVVTETIGALGPEENIVELTHNFLQRHPSVRRLIPSKLSIYAVPVRSDVVETVTERFLRSFSAASHDRFSYDAIMDDLRYHVGRHLFTTDLSQAAVLGEETLLVAYDLGRTENSAFDATVRVPPGGANAVHLFFRCQLADDVLLESRLSAPPNHWRHSFVAIPPGFDTLHVHYRRARFVFTWSDSGNGG